MKKKRNIRAKIYWFLFTFLMPDTEETLTQTFVHSFIYSAIFIKHLVLLCAGHCSRCCGYISLKKSKKSLPSWSLASSERRHSMTNKTDKYPDYIVCQKWTMKKRKIRSQYRDWIIMPTFSIAAGSYSRWQLHSWGFGGFTQHQVYYWALRRKQEWWQRAHTAG